MSRFRVRGKAFDNEFQNAPGKKKAGIGRVC
jgi:hypothetical protein